MKIKTILFICLNLVISQSFAATNNSTVGKDFNYFSNHFMTKSVNQITNHIELLFVENAGNASLITDLDKKGCMHLSLWPVTGDIHYFTNEPVRRSGSISPENFVAFWHKQDTATQSFIPNVDIEGVMSNHNSFDEPAALSHAQYDLKHEKMTYLACPLPAHHLQAIRHMRVVSIFFDGFTGWPPI